MEISTTFLERLFDICIFATIRQGNVCKSQEAEGDEFCHHQLGNGFGSRSNLWFCLHHETKSTLEWTLGNIRISKNSSRILKSCGFFTYQLCPQSAYSVNSDVALELEDIKSLREKRSVLQRTSKLFGSDAKRDVDSVITQGLNYLG